MYLNSNNVSLVTYKEMKRDIIKIDEDLCTGCGDCVPNCHEGALQIIDGKARLISDLMCDGLGACIGHCPEGAITMEKREAEPYDEITVIKEMSTKGRNTVVAHLQHLKEHNEMKFLQQGVQWLEENRETLAFELDEVKNMVHNMIKPTSSTAAAAATAASAAVKQAVACGCAGSAPKDFRIDMDKVNASGRNNGGGSTVSAPTELRQWPVQLHLLNPQTGYFQNADVVLAADCSAFTIGSFHNDFIKGRTLAIACPKLDTGLDSYLEKLISMINDAKINTLTVVVMEVPCCGGLIQLAQTALSRASRKIPLKRVVVSIRGEVMAEEWI